MTLIDLQELIHDLPGVDLDRVRVHEGDSLDEVILNIATLAGQHPDYSKLAARVLLKKITKPFGLKESLEYGVKFGLVDPRLLTQFDLGYLESRLVPTRDNLLSYLGALTLYDRYLLHDGGDRFETPQVMFMRVAMGLTFGEPKETTASVYDAISSFDFLPSSPTLFNAGLVKPQLASCFVSTIGDSLDSIMSAVFKNGIIQKWAGGLGNDWTNVRGRGALIKGTNGPSNGIIPFISIAEATLNAVNQGSRRRGAGCAFLELWHSDIYEFIDLRKSTGDGRMRVHAMNTAVWVPDLFMKRVMADGQWSLFSPDEVSDLHHLYGDQFEAAYLKYEELGERGKLATFKKVSAVQLWQKILTALFTTGHPWITFKDAFNLRNTQAHKGTIYSSNLCTEIGLNTSPNEVAVCNLASINLANHISPDGSIDYDKIKKTVRLMVRVLDNIIDHNFYPVEEAKANQIHRPIGIGVMGYQDALYKLKIPWESVEGVEFSDRILEFISYHAIDASSDLALERGPYQSYIGSLWSLGILPIHSLDKLAQEPRTIDKTQTMPWAELRKKVMTQGMRNSNCLAIAPTATISNLANVSQSIEPTYSNAFVNSNLSGEFMWVNPYLVSALQAIGLWNESIVEELKMHDGSVQNIEAIPAEIKLLFKTAFEINPRKLIEAASRRQKWVDQSQSLNIYLATPDGRLLSEVYMLAWKLGLKSTYYLHSRATTKTCDLPSIGDVCEACS